MLTVTFTDDEAHIILQAIHDIHEKYQEQRDAHGVYLDDSNLFIVKIDKALSFIDSAEKKIYEAFK